MQRFRPYHIQVEYARKNLFSRTRLISSEEQFIEKIIPLPEELGRGEIHAFNLHDGLGYGDLIINETKETFKIFGSIEEDLFKFLFTLSYDHLAVKTDGIKEKIILNSNFFYVLSPGNFRADAHINRSAHINLICVYVPPDILENVLAASEMRFPKDFYNKFIHSYHKPFYKKGGTNPVMRMIGNQLQNCPIQGSLKRLYIESKLLELLAIQLSQLCCNKYSAVEKKELSNSTIERIKTHEAMEILSSRIQNPPTISGLAQMVGLNTTSLKRGFKEETGSTVFGYVKKLRTQQALIFLRDTDMNVSEIAWEIGYSTVSGFSAAFRREMGFSPSVLRKERG